MTLRQADVAMDGIGFMQHPLPGVRVLLDAGLVGMSRLCAFARRSPDKVAGE